MKISTNLNTPANHSVSLFAVSSEAPTTPALNASKTKEKTAPTNTSVVEVKPPFLVHKLASVQRVMGEQELKNLTKSIKLWGVKERIVITPRPEGGWWVIDGRDRLRALELLGRSLSPDDKKLFRQVKLDSDEAILQELSSRNFSRKHHNESQRAMVGARLLSELTENTGKLREKVASIVNVCKRSIQSAKRVLDRQHPGLIECVEAGLLGVSTAELACEMPNDELDLLAKPQCVEVLKSRVLNKQKWLKQLNKNGDEVLNRLVGSQHVELRDAALFARKVSKEEQKQLLPEDASPEAYTEAVERTVTRLRAGLAALPPASTPSSGTLQMELPLPGWTKPLTPTLNLSTADTERLERYREKRGLPDLLDAFAEVFFALRFPTAEADHRPDLTGTVTPDGLGGGSRVYAKGST